MRGRRQGRTQVEVIGGAGRYAALEQMIFIRTGRQGCRKAEGRGAAGGTVERLHHLDAILQRGGAGAACVDHIQAGGAVEAALAHHQSIAGRAVAVEPAVEREPPAIAGVISVDRQGIASARIGGSHVDKATVVDVNPLAGCKRFDYAGSGLQLTRTVEVQRTGAGRAIAQLERAAQRQLRAVAHVNGFPVGQHGRVAGLGVVQGQRVIAQAAVNPLCRSQLGTRQVVQRRGVVTRPCHHRGVEVATRPGEPVIAEAEQHLALDLTPGDGHTVVAAADADIAANNAGARHLDGVFAEPGHQVADNGACAHLEHVVIELHINPPDGAPGHSPMVTVFKSPGDGAAADLKFVQAVSLGE